MQWRESNSPENPAAGEAARAIFSIAFIVIALACWTIQRHSRFSAGLISGSPIIDIEKISLWGHLWKSLDVTREGGSGLVLDPD